MERGVVAWQCVNAACARGMPHKVRFCPYCGTAQETTGASATAAALAAAAGAASHASAAHAGARAAGMPGYGGSAEEAARGAQPQGANDGGLHEEGERAGGAGAAAAGPAPARPRPYADALRGLFGVRTRTAPPSAAAASSADLTGRAADVPRGGESRAAGSGGPGTSARSDGSHAAGSGALPGGANVPGVGSHAAGTGGSSGANVRSDGSHAAGSSAAPGASAGDRVGAGAAQARPNQTMYGVPRPPGGPGQAGARGGTHRKPVRLRTLIAVFVVLWLIWMWTKPDKFAERVEQAVTLASVCNTSAARKELAALEAANANARQLDRIRAAIASAQPACQPEPAPRGSTKPRSTRRPESGQRADAAAPQSQAAQSGTRADAVARAAPAPSYGQRATDTAAPRAAPAPYNGQRAADVVAPRAGDSGGRAAPGTPPSAQAAQASSAQSARTLILEARRAIANGNYRTAINRMDVCITMIEPVPQECRTLRISAEYQQQAMERCLASGADWVGDHCE